MSPDRGGGGVAPSRLLMRRGPVASRNQHCVLPCEVGVCPAHRGSVEGHAPQIGDGGAYLYTVAAALMPGCCRAHLRGAGAFGPLATWHGVPSVPSFTLGVAARCCSGSWVVVCAGHKVCVGRFCTTSGLWLCQREGGGGGTSPH